MIKKMKDYIWSYNALYWASIIMIIALSAALYLSSSFSGAPTNQMIEEALVDSDSIKENLAQAKASFSAYDMMLSETANFLHDERESWVDAFDMQSAILFGGFHDLHPYISGYFIQLGQEDSSAVLQKYYDFDAQKESHISVLMDAAYVALPGGLEDRLKTSDGPMFVTIPSSLIGGFKLACVAPLHIDGEYWGFVGVDFDKAMLGGMFGGDIRNGRKMTLLTSELEIIASTEAYPVGSRLQSIQNAQYARFAGYIMENPDDIVHLRRDDRGQRWMNIAVRLPSGQIFWEGFDIRTIMGAANMLILLLSLFSIFCIWFVQKRNGSSPFDQLSGRVLAGKGQLDAEQNVSQNASFALHIALLFVSLALFIFALVGKSGVMETVSFACFSIVTLLLLVWYRSADHPKIAQYLYLAYFMLMPVIMHHITGGFASENAGQVIIFSVMAVMVSSFVLKGKKFYVVFPIFIFVLFVVAIIEIYTARVMNQETIIRYVIVICFLGFALFLSTDLYVSGVIDLLGRLKDAQSLLIKKEKMVTLGQLVAGVAHEINTPLGAIKASAESIDAALHPAFHALMDAGGALTPGDREAYFRLVELAMVSMNEMYTTSQIRKAKPVIRAFFEELGYKDPQHAVEMLARLEICNLEVLQKNRDIFVSPGIDEMLMLLTRTMPIVRGSYIIAQSTAKMSKIVFALKSYSHSTVASDFIWVNVVQNVDNVLVLLYNQMKRSVELVKNYEDDLPEIRSNPDELGQVWINLIQNALHAMKGAGILAISIRKEQQMIKVSISDNGGGISPDVIDHVFEPFYTTKIMGEGTGLGLDICKKIVTGHGGSIAVTSVPNVGTTFDVRLPVQSSE